MLGAQVFICTVILAVGWGGDPVVLSGRNAGLSSVHHPVVSGPAVSGPVFVSGPAVHPRPPIIHHRPPPLISHSAASSGHHGLEDAAHANFDKDIHSATGDISRAMYGLSNRHNMGVYGDSGSYGENHGHNDNQRNYGTFSKDRGYGYEKSYAYDRETGTHDVVSNSDGGESYYGNRQVAKKHDLGSLDKHGHHGNRAYDTYGVRDHGNRGRYRSHYGYYGGYKNYDPIFEYYGYPEYYYY